MDNNKKALRKNKFSFEKADVLLSISIGTSIAIGMGAGVAVGFASDSSVLGLLMGSLYALLIGLFTIRNKKSK